MNLEPQKFFIGLMDFFSILMPGALFTYFLMGEVGSTVLGDEYMSIAGSKGWAMFLFSSYLLGHLIFLAGSWLDEVYDWLRGYTLNKQYILLARRGRVLPWVMRFFIWLIFRREQNLAVNKAIKIKNNSLGALQAKDAVNAFQWSKVVLSAESPESLVAVQRFEADSKFFRSFVIVLFLMVVSWPWHQQWSWQGNGFVLVILFLSLWRYMDQRLKSTNQAYWSVITLTAKAGTISFDKVLQEDGAPTHAGGVVFRGNDDQTQYLLVEASDDSEQWVLPKGHIEDGEHPRETAVREVKEEAGTWAGIQFDLGPVTYAVDGKSITVQYYLMKFVCRGLRHDSNREHVWLPYKKALERRIHPETRGLLASAERHRESMSRNT